MKLFGNSRNSRHTGIQAAEKKKSAAAPQKRKNRGLKAIIIILAVILALLVAALAWIKFGVKPPDVSDKRPNSQSSSEQPAENGDPVDPEKPEQKPTDQKTSERLDEKYTFLVLGSDDGNGNTDTIMVVNFDVTNYKINIVSIPRDTMVNVSWAVKKVNSLYTYSGVDGMMDHFADILGFRPDFYINVDLNAFSKLVDAVGGIDYYVPRNMYYKDPYQDLYIDISEGMHHLDGADALKVVRFRSGYINADIGRIDTQQDFLKTAAAQILANKDSIKLTSLVEIFIKYVNTDLTYGNVAWFAKEFLKVNPDNIVFHTLPGKTDDYVYQGGESVSYVTIYPNQWLDMINEYLNPYADDITMDELSILTRGSDGYIYSTNGVYQGYSSWGNYVPPSSSSGSGGESGYSGGYSGGDDPGYYDPGDDPGYDPGDEPEENPVENPGGETGEGPGETPVDEPVEEPGGETGGSDEQGGDAPWSEE